MNTASKGRRNEHRFRDYLLSREWAVLRSAGSFGVADLIALGFKVLFVNIKTNQFAPPKERNELLTIVKRLRKHLPTEAVLVRFDDGCKEPRARVYSFTSKAWYDVTPGYFNQ